MHGFIERHVFMLLVFIILFSFLRRREKSRLLTSSYRMCSPCKLSKELTLFLMIFMEASIKVFEVASNKWTRKCEDACLL